MKAKSRPRRQHLLSSFAPPWKMTSSFWHHEGRRVSWGLNSVAKAFTGPAWGPEFDLRPGEVETGRSLELTSHRTRTIWWIPGQRGSVSKENKVDGAWGTTPEVVLWPLHTHTPVYLHIDEHTHTQKNARYVLPPRVVLFPGDAIILPLQGQRSPSPHLAQLDQWRMIISRVRK